MHQSGGEAEGLELPEALLLDTSPAVLAGMSNCLTPAAFQCHTSNDCATAALQRPGAAASLRADIGSPERKAERAGCASLSLSLSLSLSPSLSLS